MRLINLIPRRREAKRNAQRLARILAIGTEKTGNGFTAGRRMPAETGSHPRIGQART